MCPLISRQSLPDFDLLRAFAAGDPFAAVVLQQRLQPALLRYARIHGWGLAADIQAEIVQQTWLALIRRDNEAWLSGRVRREAYLRGVVRDAAEVVRSQYRSAGESSRLRGRWRQRSRIDPATSHKVIENVPDEGNLERAVLARIELQSLMDRATPDVREALRLLCEDGATLDTAASAAGLTRRTLTRRLEHLRSSHN